MIRVSVRSCNTDNARRMLQYREKPHRLPDDRYLGRISVAFTMCVEKRRPLFAEPRIVQVHKEKLFDHALRRDCRTSLFCFMPDHVHVILSGLSDEANPKAAIEGFKTSSGIWLGRHYPGTHWQDGYHDRIIRDHQEWCNRVRYILDNPVRGRLVSGYEEYPYLGCQDLQLEDLLGSLT